MGQDGFYFPSEGRRAEDFFAMKNPTASAGFEPANLETGCLGIQFLFLTVIQNGERDCHITCVLTICVLHQR
jgi:hypothetical protein